MTWQQNQGGGYGNNNNGGNRGGWGGGNRSFTPKPPVPITTKVTTGGLEVCAPYNVEFVEEAKAMRGRWVKEQKLWVFDPAKQAEVDDLLSRIFGDAWKGSAAPAAAPPREQPRLPYRPQAAPAPLRERAPEPWDAPEQNGVKTSELPAAFAPSAVRDPASEQEPPENGYAPEPIPNEPVVAEVAPKHAALVKGKILRLGEELSNLDFEALTCEELFAFSERLSNAARVLAFEAGRRPRKAK